ncbi:MAG: A24 family peptidase [Gammaproteobacteria bacterium]|nr:A24 family peptidase [Gammaproteobacteria bacterium]NNM12833.1 prepilin peptidase [Gammaproteobacteria bacterium]
MTVFDLFIQNTALLISAVFLLGLAVGSFLNVVIHRTPLMMKRDWRMQAIEILDIGSQFPDEETSTYNLVKPDSHCPKCDHKIRWYENLPVISYLVLKGKCSSCKNPISLRYPLVELLTGIVSGFIAWHFGATTQLLPALILSWGIIAMVGIDFDHQLLPDSLTLPLLWLGLLVNTQSLFVGPVSAITGAAAGYFSLWSIYWVFKLVTGKEGMGYGDFKMLAMVGAWLGWQVLPVTLLLSAVVGLAVMLPQMLFLGREKSKAFAFGPFIGIAGWIMLVWGNEILTYLRYI